ncbi:hypothetical protein, conserved [Eimeria praecox]|uniref:Uncharacterized protein n=1 Tax=Eimeria praecox TaxID=51316 RepID=U6H171_9EIME|nr:hypothetical protein, conserved [Eimeria praecox]
MTAFFLTLDWPHGGWGRPAAAPAASREPASAGAAGGEAATLTATAAFAETSSRRRHGLRRARLPLLFSVFISLFLSISWYALAGTPPDTPSPEDDIGESNAERKDSNPTAPKQPGQPGGGVPVPSVFQVAEDDIPPELRFAPPILSTASSMGHRSISPPVQRDRRPSGAGAASSGAVVVSEMLQPYTYGRVGATFGSVLVLTDVDDTLWCSGSMAAFGKHIGGIDSELGRGLPYPGIGTLLFMLALGPHTSTPSGLRIPIEHCPVPLPSPQTQNCPYDVQQFPVQHFLPRRAGVLSARVSTSLLAQFTRPPSFFRDIDAIFTSGARQLYGAGAPRWPLGYQNQMKFAQVLSSQNSRGEAKIWGFTEAISGGGPAVVLGDTGEKDPEAAAGMAVKYPESLGAVLLHSVFLNRQKEIDAGTGRQRREMPKHMIPFVMDVSGVKLPAVQLVYEILVKVRGGEEVQSFGDLSEEVAYAAGVQIAADVRQLFKTATRRQLLAAEARASGDPGSSPLAPPVIFIHVTRLHTQVLETPQEVGVAGQLANFSSKLAMKVSRWSAKKFSPNPELIDIAGFRQRAEVLPVFLQSPVQKVSPQGVRYPLGVPFASYRTAVGAAFASWALGMLTTQDVMSLIVAAIRDLRSLGPPNHCWQRTVVHEMLVDVAAVQHFLGPLEARTDLRGAEVFADAVSALEAFELFHKEHCGPRDPAIPTPQALCLEKLEAALAQHAANGGPANARQQLLPILSLACRYREQMDHWLSAGPEEVESLAFFLGRAIIIGSPAASLLYADKDRQEEASQQQEQQQQSHQQEPQQQQQQMQQQQLQQQQMQQQQLQQQQMQQQQLQPNANIPNELSLFQLHRDMARLPELAVELHTDPEEAPSLISPSLQMAALDVQTVEDLRPFLPDDYSVPTDVEASASVQQPGDGGRRSPRGSRRRDVGGLPEEENGGGGDYLGDCGHRKPAPVSLWLGNLRNFCANSRDPAGTEACGVLKRWLLGPEEQTGPPTDGEGPKRSRAALPALIRVADWNTQKPKSALEIPELGIVLEPYQLRPGATGREELEKAQALNVVGGIYAGRGTVRHQRPSERAVWQRIAAALKVIMGVECSDLFG